MSRQSRKRYRGIIRNRKRRIERRLRRKQYEDQPKAVMAASNIHFEMGEKTQGISCGGIGAIHQMVRRVGLADMIDEELRLLKVHLPYHESDHVLTIAYNVLLGGMRLEDIEVRRQDEVFLNAVGAERIPDPTTAGDFTRRFSPETIEVLDGMHQCGTAARVAEASRGAPADEVHLKSSLRREKTRRASLQQGAACSACLAQPDKSGFLHLQLSDDHDCRSESGRRCRAEAAKAQSQPLRPPKPGVTPQLAYFRSSGSPTGPKRCA